MRSCLNRSAHLVWIFLALGLLSHGASASPLSERAAEIKPHHTPITEHVQKDSIIVKFKEGTQVRLREGRHVSLRGADLSAFHALLKNYPGICVHRLFSRTEEDLDQEKQTSEQHSGWQLADLNLFSYFLQTFAPA